MADLKLIKPLGVQNIINKFCLTIGMIPSSYKLSLTYEEQILAIGHYLEESVIPALNNNAEAVAELQALFVQLKDYVENYFDDLNIQNEINAKLDEMANSGKLGEIINEEIFEELNGQINNLENSISTNLFSNKNSKKFAILGDSNAEGYGMWQGNKNNKTNENDGIFSFLRKKYPQHTFENLAVSGTTLLQLQEQINDLQGDYEAIFILSGMNDITNAISNSNANSLGYALDPFTFNQSEYPETSCGALALAIQNLKNYTNNIYYIVSPTTGNNYFLYLAQYNEYIKLCKIFGVNVINLYSVMPYYNYNKNYFYDSYHPNEKAFEEIIVPFIESSVTGERNQYILNKTKIKIVPYTINPGNPVQTFKSFYNIVETLSKNLDWYDEGKYIITNLQNNFWYVDFSKNNPYIIIKATHYTGIEYYAKLTYSNNEINISDIGTTNTCFNSDFKYTALSNIFQNESFVIKDTTSISDLPDGIDNSGGYIYGKSEVTFDNNGNFYRIITLKQLLTNTMYVITWLNNTKRITKFTGENI